MIARCQCKEASHLCVMLQRNRECGRQLLEAWHLEQACLAMLWLFQHDINRHSGCHVPQQSSPQMDVACPSHMHNYRTCTHASEQPGPKLICLDHFFRRQAFGQDIPPPARGISTHPGKGATWRGQQQEATGFQHEWHNQMCPQLPVNMTHWTGTQCTAHNYQHQPPS